MSAMRRATCLRCRPPERALGRKSSIGPPVGRNNAQASDFLMPPNADRQPKPAKPARLLSRTSSHVSQVSWRLAGLGRLDGSTGANLHAGMLRRTKEPLVAILDPNFSGSLSAIVMSTMGRHA